MHNVFLTNKDSKTEPLDGSSPLVHSKSIFFYFPPQAIDPVGLRNPGCVSPSPQLFSPQRPLPAAALSRRQLSLARRLQAPSSLFPAGYTPRCSLDSSRRGCGAASRIVPEAAVPAYTRCRMVECNVEFIEVSCHVVEFSNDGLMSGALECHMFI